MEMIFEPTLLLVLLTLQHHNHSRTPPFTNDYIKNRYVRTDITTIGENSNFVAGVMEQFGFWLLFGGTVLGTGYTRMSRTFLKTLLGLLLFLQVLT